MRPGNSGRRPRGRPNRKQHHHGGGGGQRGHNFDSSGPEGRIRGNAHQIYERYLALARDATSAGDRISAEAYFQHAEHYFRIINDSTDPRANGQDGQRNRQNGPDGPRDGGYRGHGGEGRERYANGPDNQQPDEQRSEPQERRMEQQDQRPQNQQRPRRRPRDGNGGAENEPEDGGSDKEPANV